MKKHLLIFLFIVLSNALAIRSWGRNINIDSLVNVATAKAPKEAALYAKDVSIALNRATYYQENISFVNKITSILKANESDCRAEIAFMLVSKINSFQYLGKLDSFDLYYPEAIIYAQKHSIHDYLTAIRLKGVVFKLRNQLDSAMYYFNIGLNISKKYPKEHQSYWAFLGEFGNFYYFEKNWKKAIEYYRESLKVGGKNKYAPIILADVYFNYGSAFAELRVYDSAFYYLDKAQAAYTKDGGYDAAASIYNIKSSILYSQGNVIQAIAMAEKSLKIYDTHVWNVINAMVCLTNLAQYNLSIGNVTKAEHYLARADTLSKKEKSLIDQQYTQGLYALVYASEHKYKEANDAWGKSITLADSVYAERRVDELSQKEAKFNNQKLRAEKAEADKNIAEEKAAKQILWFAVMLAASLSVAGFVAYWQQRKRKFIAEQNAEIQKLLAEESTALAEANAQRLEQEQELAQQNEELLVIQESRNAELAKERAHWLATMREIQDYLSAKKYDTLNTFVVEKMKPVSQNSATELKNILSEMQANFPQFIPNLIAAYPELASRPKLQDLAVLLAKNTLISEVATLLFSGQVGTAKNNQRELRVILNFPPKDYEGVRAYLRTLMYKS